ncbi:hypothetical protein, partial [Buchananella hordeovulneris]|uniref:hypothetical protein n=1 Tax=Buchananella hordeovulneris TaxID=52770 RepID=UPI001FEF9F19
RIPLTRPSLQRPRHQKSSSINHLSTNQHAPPSINLSKIDHLHKQSDTFSAAASKNGPDLGVLVLLALDWLQLCAPWGDNAAS